VALTAVLGLIAAVAVPVAPSAPAVVKPIVFRVTVVKGRPVGGIKRPVVTKGKLVRIVVVTDLGTKIHLHGYDFEKAVRPGRPVVFQFVAKLPGRFELELHSPDVLLAQLTVKP
jgi:hypothetical protein